MDKATADTMLADSTVILAVATFILMIATGYLAWFTRQLARYTETLSKLTDRLVAIEEQRDRREREEKRRADITKCVTLARTIYGSNLDTSYWNDEGLQRQLKEVISAVEELLPLEGVVHI